MWGKFVGATLALMLVAGTPFASVGLITKARATATPIGEKPIRIQVRYQFPLPGVPNSLEDRIKLIENGRKMIYSMAAGECTRLLAAIAKSCVLKSLNVSNQIRNPRHNQTVTMSGSATYEITLKSAD